MDNQAHDLILRAIDQTITPSEFEQLQDLLEHHEDVRVAYVRAIDMSERLSEIAQERDEGASQSIEAVVPTEQKRSVTWNYRALGLVSLAASLLLVVGYLAFWFGHENAKQRNSLQAEGNSTEDQEDELLLAGHATLRTAIDIQWSGPTHFRDGDVLPNGPLMFDAGTAEIDFFCGATLIVEGPASLEVESDWSVRVLEGRLRAHVPPAARGFIVKAADAEIIDLGTEFALEVGTESSRVEVIDGEVELRGGEFDGSHLITGQGQSLHGNQDSPIALDGLSTADDVRRASQDAEADRFTKWKSQASQGAQDARLLAYYPIARELTVAESSNDEKRVRNQAPTGPAFDGQVIGPVQRTPGRFGGLSAGLEFDRPGARVRTRIDGTFDAFTFACWVKIDSLEHVYNALFMSDGYENGEPHWQIRDDGRLMFSVMVDDSQDVRVSNRFDQRLVRDAGKHRVYFTPPFWNNTMRGKWFHLAAVYDPTERLVTQYVNGAQLSQESISDEFHITDLHIGPAEIGNWGQPFRQSPWFAVRNLNGTIDELAIYKSALTTQEIESLYQQGKPLGY